VAVAEGGKNVNSTDREKIVAIMKENSRHAYLATCDGDQPRVRPVSPIVGDDMSLWVATYASSRKVKQIKDNPKVCMAFVAQPDGDKAAFVLATAEIIPAADEKKRVWGLAPFDLSQYFAEGPGSPEFCLLKMIINKIEWWDSWTEGPKVYEPKKAK